MKDSIIRELALKYILKSKVFYLIMSITIIVTTMFITAILSFGVILNDNYNNLAKGDNGKYEVSVNSIDYDISQAIIKELNISNYSTTSEIKEIMVDDKKGESISVDNDYLNTNELKVIQGAYPKADSEICVDEEFFKKYNYSLGETVKINNTDDVKIVGVISNFKFIDNKNGYRIYLKKSLESGILTNLYIKSEKSEMKNYIDSIKKYVDVKQILINDNAVNSAGNSFTSMAAVLTALLLVATFFSINNLYAINFKKRLSNIGMLITVGTTDKQVSKLFNYEVLIFSTIPILIGLAFGNLLTYLIIKLGASDINLKYFLSVKVLIIVYVLFFITILISVKSLIVKIKNTTPIEAVKVLEKKNIFTRKRKKIKISSSLFNDIAKSNIRRNLKSSIINMTSIIISGILIIFVITCIKSYDYKKMVKLDIYSDIKFYPMDEDIKVRDLESINSIRSVEWYKKGVAKDSTPNINLFDVVVTNKVGMEKISKDNGIEISENDATGTNVLLYQGPDAKKYQDRLPFKYKVGDSIDLVVSKLINIQGGGIDFESIDVSRSVTISKVLNELEISFPPPYQSFMYTIIVEENSPLAQKIMGSEKFKVFQINTDTGKEIDVKKSILAKYNSNIIQVSTVDDLMKDVSNSYKQILFLANIITILVLAVVLFNYILSITTTLLSRRKEFGMLRAIGFTDNDVKKMINREFIIFNFITILSIIIIGNTISYLYIKSQTIDASFIVFTPQYILNILLASVILLVQFVMSNVLIKVINNEAIIEQVKDNQY